MKVYLQFRVPLRPLAVKKAVKPQDFGRDDVRTQPHCEDGVRQAGQTVEMTDARLQEKENAGIKKIKKRECGN